MSLPSNSVTATEVSFVQERRRMLWEGQRLTIPGHVADVWPRVPVSFVLPLSGEEVWGKTGINPQIQIENKEREQSGEARRTDSRFFSFKNKMISWKKFGLKKVEDKVMLKLKIAIRTWRCNTHSWSVMWIKVGGARGRNRSSQRFWETTADKIQWRLSKISWTHSCQVTSLVFTFALLLPTFEERFGRMADESF